MINKTHTIIARLNILEPWDSGTETPIGIKEIKKFGKDYLFRLERPHKIKEILYIYLIGRPIDSDINLFSSNSNDGIILEMCYNSNINKENFIDYPIDSFRGNFLKGELIQ